MESGHNEEAIGLFRRHVRVLLDKKLLYEHDKEKLDTIDGDIQLINSLLTDIQQKLLASSKSFTLIKEDKMALEREISCYSKAAQETLRRMVTYNLRHYTFQDVVGHQWAKA